MNADFDLGRDGSVTRATHIPRLGGARPGAGRRPRGYEKPEEQVDYEKAKARNEEAKAALNELKFRVESGEYLSRRAFREASATLLAELAQGLRSIPDTLERKSGLLPEHIQFVQETLDTALQSVADGLELFTGGDD